MNNKFTESLFGEAFANSGINKDDFDEAVAIIRGNDNQISGGREIVNQKSNQLFTGQFEKSDMDDFCSIWLQYKRDIRLPIRSRLMQKSRSMINNYHGEVCPIEVMLYTSNLVANMFVNKRLMHDVAEVVFEIFKIKESYFKSIKHILNVWKWGQAISVCEIAAGKIRDNDLIRYICDNFSEDDETRYGCFCALMSSGNEEFIPSILKMVHDMTGSDIDKQIGNIFRRDFVINFPDYYSRLDLNMFADSKPYVQEMIRKMIDPKRNDNMTNRYRESIDKESKIFIAQTALDRIVKDIPGAMSSPYDAINVLKMAASPEISEKLLESLNLRGKPVQKVREVAAAVVCSYFGYINYPPAIQQFSEAKTTDELYASERVALFRQDKLGSDEITKDFLTESRPEQVKLYLGGFWGLGEKIPPLRASLVNFLRKDLPDHILSNAITNYMKMVQRHRQLYDPQVGELIKSWFGFNTQSKVVKLHSKDQTACLAIIETIIGPMNYETYEGFLYYVAEEGWNFAPAVGSFAKRILLKLPNSTIKA